MNNLFGNLLGLFFGPLFGLWAVFYDWRFDRAVRRGEPWALDIQQENRDTIQRLLEQLRMMKQAREHDAKDAGAYYP